MYRVPASGGQPIAVTEAYKGHDEANHIWPEFLPDGRHFLFLVLGRDDEGIHVGSLDSKEHRLVLRESSSVAYVEPGYLLFGRNGVLMAQRFDAKRIQTFGDPARIVDALETASGNGYSFSVWLIDSRGVATRFTFGDYDLNPICAPDGASVIFSSPRDGLPPNLFQKSLAGGSEERRLMHSVIDSIATDWSRDGRHVVYMTNELGTNWNIWVMPLAGNRTPQPVLRTEFNEMDGRISPDGRWLAYVSDESGQWQVYVQRFLSSGGKWQVSSAGGNQPQWSHDGKELFYIASDQKLMIVTVHPGQSLEPGTPKPLFQLHTPNDSLISDYDVDRDDQRFLVSTLVSDEPSPPLTVVMNWTAILETK